jgi:hypothetical protein
VTAPPRPHGAPAAAHAAWLAGSRASDLALIAAVLVAGSVSRHAVYTPYGVTILVLATGALAAAVWRGLRAPSRLGVLLALAGAAVAQVIKPPYMNVDGRTWLLRAGVYACLAGTLLAGALLLPRVAGVPRRRTAVAGAALAAVATGYLLVIRGSTRPLIDVWAILQGAALGVVHGQNPYDLVYANVPPGQVNDCFNYLPATFLVPVPTRLLFGDVRYAEAAVLFAGVAAALYWTLRRADAVDGRLPTGPVLALLFGLLPGALYDVQQAWNETILAGALVGGAVLLATGRSRSAWWAAACLGLALATKQHIVLLLPLWACWPAFGVRRAAAAAAGAAAVGLPWVLADFGRFKHCVLDFFVDLPARPDSLSLWHLLPGPLQAAAVLALTVGGYALALRRLPRTPGGLLVGCGLVLAAFDLANKQSFLNQWLLAAQLVVAGLALVGTERPAGADAERGTVFEHVVDVDS